MKNRSLTDEHFKSVIRALNAAMVAPPSQFERLCRVAARFYLLSPDDINAERIARIAAIEYKFKQQRKARALGRIAMASRLAGAQFGPMGFPAGASIGVLRNHTNATTGNATGFAQAWLCESCGNSNLELADKCGRCKGKRKFKGIFS